jgi:hypothetical protein
MEEWMRRMKDMARMGGGGGMNFYGALPDTYKVAEKKESINANHKKIRSSSSRSFTVCSSSIRATSITNSFIGFRNFEKQICYKRS